jgi:integrase
MTNRDAYEGPRETWPRVLTEREREAVLQAAREGEDAERSLLIVAAMMYLGLPVLEAAKVRYCTACGDAVEDVKRKAFLHVPPEYRRILLEVIEGRGQVYMGEQLITCTQKEAENAVKSAFERAGIPKEFCFMRLRRTAAWMHYENQWTPGPYIERWFKEIDYIKDKQQQYFYREKTDDDIQAEIDENIMKMMKNTPSLYGGKK